jgi:hypothetical protein
MPDLPVTVSRSPGVDAQRYQEKHVRDALSQLEGRRKW